jgi:hypothetical protein
MVRYFRPGRPDHVPSYFCADELSYQSGQYIQVLTIDRTTARFGTRRFRLLPFFQGGGKDELMLSPG